MKSISFTFILIVFLNAVFAQGPVRTPTPNDNLKPTEVLSNGDVVLRIYAPNSTQVTIGGDIIPWGQKYEGEKAENGIWTFTVPQVKAGTYRYHFMVDGVKVSDPKAPNANETSALIDVLPDGSKGIF